MNFKRVIKNLLLPTRKLGGHFFKVDELDEINYRPRGIYNAREFLISENIEGDYLEFGVFEGISFTHAIKALSICPRTGQKTNRRFFAFDSFEGLPVGDERFERGEYSKSEEDFISILKQNNVYGSNVQLVKGWYQNTCVPETIEKQNMHKVAFAYFDCDLYESTITALNFIVPLLQDGSLLSFNDYWCYKGRSDKGQQRAINEWLESNPHITLKEFIKWGYSDTTFAVQIN